jgi:hypothetical protein
MLLAFSVYDRKSASYARPFFFPTSGMALRSFIDEVNRPDENSLLYNHPADFSLHEIGQFDENTGRIAPHEDPVQLAIGEAVKVDPKM